MKPIQKETEIRLALKTESKPSLAGVEEEEKNLKKNNNHLKDKDSRQATAPTQK